MKNISTTKFIQSILMFIIATCAAVIVVLTIINIEYFCVMTNYFIPFIVIIGFSAISGIALYTFYKLWYEMFVK